MVAERSQDPPSPTLTAAITLTESTIAAAATPPTTASTVSKATAILPTSVPWPDGIYIIRERASGRALVVQGVLPRLLRETEDDEDHSQATRWHCVEANGYFAFQDVRSGKYFGHQKGGMRVEVTKRDVWEYFTPRQHPRGGYQLLSPHFHNRLMVVCVAQDGMNLERRETGPTLWEFVSVGER